jgi:hypothetical protein
LRGGDCEKLKETLTFLIVILCKEKLVKTYLVLLKLKLNIQATAYVNERAQRRRTIVVTQ